jgi:lysophospholipase L1-like esterase
MRVRIFSVLGATALLVLSAIPASATSEGHSYLALGDSVPFGFDPNANPFSASNFTGYPEIVASTLNIQDVNATCPGEATGGFISMTGTDNVCRPYRSAFPLHVSYSGTQLAYATSYLRTHPRTRLVTLTLGANDVFHLQKVCHAANLKDPAAEAACVVAGLPGVLAEIRSNLNTIFGAIRATGYTQLIVALTYYSLDYSDESGAALLNAPMIAAAKANGALIADGLAAWRAAAAGGSSCAAGLVIINLSTGACDVHPTPLGRDLLAKAVVNTIGASCPAADPIGCLNRNRG